MDLKPKAKPTEGFLNSIKVVMISLAAGITFMVWSFLSAKVIQANSQEVQTDPNTTTEDVEPEGYPTLVSLVIPTVDNVNSQVSTGSNQPTLRIVTAPTAMPSIGAPVVQTVIQYAPSAGGGGTAKSGKKPSRKTSTRTRTS